MTVTDLLPVRGTSLVAPRVRQLRVEHVMGTVFSIDVRDAVPACVLDDAVALLHEVDDVFSTWKPQSPISRLGRGELTLPQCPPQVAWVLESCEGFRRETEGWFDVQAAGSLDPSGLVKGWAVQRVSDLLSAAGSGRHAVNGGGDVAVRGPDWNVGVSDPLSPGKVLMTLRASDCGVATSGTTERGAHVLDPRSGQPATGVLSATVVGPDIVTADVWATAAVAAGREAPDLMRRSGLDHVLVMTDGSRYASLTGPRATAR